MQKKQTTKHVKLYEIEKCLFDRHFLPEFYWALRETHIKDILLSKQSLYIFVFEKVTSKHLQFFEMLLNLHLSKFC